MIMSNEILFIPLTLNLILNAEHQIIRLNLYTMEPNYTSTLIRLLIVIK